MYKRYSLKELIFKYVASLLLSSNLMRNRSLSFIKWTIAQNYGYFIKIINSIYYAGKTQQDAVKKSQQLWCQGVSSVLDYAVEGEKNEDAFDLALNTTLRLIELSRQSEYFPYVVIKPTSLGDASVYCAKSIDESYESTEWVRIVSRYTCIFEAALANKVSIMVDAEQSSIQPAVDHLIITNMNIYNKNWPLITLTLQFYLKKQTERLATLYEHSVKHQFYLGLKIVRGAYLESEKASDNRHLYFDTKAETDESFNSAIHFIAQRLDRIYPFFATHNETSLKIIMQHSCLRDLKVWTGQLYGMGDHITLSLKQKGYQVCKYLPFGPIDKSFPYLIRRMEENAVSSETLKKESTVLITEIWKRITGFDDGK